ncbi:MAG: GNAT family N-acetyltransferase [Flavobacteriales bacterium]
MDVKIHEANLHNPDQISHVILLLNAYASDIMGGGKPLPEETTHRLIPELQKRKTTLVLLAYVDIDPAGLAICFEGFSTFYAKPLLNIHDFVVAPGHRGKGIAKLMLEKLEQIARQRGYCKLTLEVLQGNERAQKIYRDFGFNGYQLDEKTGRALFWDKKLNK